MRKNKEIQRGKHLIIVMLLIALTIGTLITGCGTSTSTEQVVTEHTDSILKPITKDLYYDGNTKIVYWWNGYLNHFDHATAPTPYYSENGNLCKYHPETGEIYDITEDMVE